MEFLEYNARTMEIGSTPETSNQAPISSDNAASGRKADKKDPSAANATKPSGKRGSQRHVVREWVVTLGAALLVAWFIRSVVIEPFVVVGASMDPTFATGQFLLVDRISYRFEAPQRDDVIVFEYPDDPSQDYIKRIIGLPGEMVIIKDGAVSIKKTASSTPIALDEPYVEPSHASHDDLTVQLASTQYFVMGDNRAESSDSRAWGPLPAGNIIGRPLLRLVPLNELSYLPGVYRQSAQ